MTSPAEHKTVLHGSQREGFWWFCTTCDIKPDQWQYSIRQYAKRDAAHHTRSCEATP